MKSSPEPKTVCYGPCKRPEMIKFTSFDDFEITVYRGSQAVETVTVAKKPCAIIHENGQKSQKSQIGRAHV